jgi:excisionase family DNA binding protein
VSLLTVDEVAAMIGMGRDWVYAEARAGRIPHVKLGRYVKFRAEAVEAWLREIERGGTVAVRAKAAPPTPPQKQRRPGPTRGGLAPHARQE